jgi:hypothetical protein
VKKRIPLRTGGSSSHPAAQGRRARVANSSDIRVAAPASVDREGRLTVKPCRAVSDLDPTATSDQIIAGFNALLASLRDGGLISR